MINFNAIPDYHIVIDISESNYDSTNSAFRSANSLESLDFVTNSIQQARANSLSSTASSNLKYFNGLNSEHCSSTSQCDQSLE